MKNSPTAKYIAIFSSVHGFHKIQDDVFGSINKRAWRKSGYGGHARNSVCTCVICALVEAPPCASLHQGLPPQPCHDYLQFVVRIYLVHCLKVQYTSVRLLCFIRRLMREELIVLVPDSILSFPHARALSRLAMLAKKLTRGRRHDNREHETPIDYSLRYRKFLWLPEQVRSRQRVDFCDCHYQKICCESKGIVSIMAKQVLLQLSELLTEAKETPVSKLYKTFGSSLLL